MPDEIPKFDDWVKTVDPNRQALSNPRVREFLDKIGKSEGADYNTLVGGSRINDLSRHPNRVGLRTVAGPSTAFGKYQIVGSTDRSKLAKYRHLDYSPENQDLRAVELLRQTGALEALERGDEAAAIKRAGREWASIPGSPLPGRKNTAAFRQQKPADIPAFDEWIKSQSEAVEPPTGRGQAMASTTPIPTLRRQPRQGRVESSGLGAAPPRISRADVMRAEEQPPPSIGMIPRGVDPRLLKGEQPSDLMAYAKAQELVGRVEPIREVGGIRAGATAMGPRQQSVGEKVYDVLSRAPGIRSLDTPAGVKTDPIRGALSLGMVDLRRTITPEEKIIDPDAEAKAETAYQTGAFVPAVVPYAAAGKVVSKIPSLNAATREAHIARSALTFGGVELGRELARSAQTGEPLNPKEVAISTAIGGGIGGLAGVDPGLKKQLVAFITPGVVADVARGTDPETATFNALTNLAFGLHSYKQAPREVKNAAKVASEQLKGEGRVTKVPESIRGVSEPPIREEVLSQSVAEVGGGAPELRRLQREISRSESPEVANAPRATTELDAAPQAITPTNRSSFEATASREIQRASEMPRDAGSVSIPDAPVKTQWQHRDFGLVSESPNQANVGRGRVRVTAEDGAEHVIQRPAGTGAGNQIAIPVRKESTPPAEISTRPSSETSAPTPTAVPLLKREAKPSIDPSEFINLRKLNISAEEKANLENTVRQVVSEGRVSKERVTFEDIKREAAEIDPDLVRNLKPPKRGETLDPAVRFAARERLNTLNAESVRLQKELDTKRASAGSDPKEIEQLESRLAQTETDAKGVLDVLIPTRSQDGRNLAFHAMQAKQSFDADYWLSKARRVAERSGEDVTSGRYQRKEKTIRDTLVAGRDAESRLAELEKQVTELRAKLEKADSGAAPEGKPTRAFRQKVETLQAKLDTAAEQARMRLKQRAESGGVQGGQAGASTIPLDIADYAIIGASKLAKKGISTAAWTEEMIAEFGESIRPHLRSIYNQSYKVYQDESKALREAVRVQTVTEGKPERYTQAEIAKLVEQADAARKDVQRNRAQLARTFSNLEKTSVLETISALRKAGLLTGVKTHLRNVGSTAAYQGFDEVARIPAAITDLAVSAVTRRRSISGANPAAVGRSSYQAATKGVKEAIQILKQGATQEDLAKLDIKREVNSGWRVIDAYTNGVFRLLGAQDKVFKTYAIKRSLEDQARVIALNESRAGQLTRGEIARRTKELSESPTAEMAATAISDAEIATFNNRGVISGAIQRGKSHLGQGGRFGLDLLVPFVQTPSNVFTRLIEATPLGAAKAIGRGSLATFNKNFTIEEQRAFSQTMGRSATGTSLILLGYLLASKGLATGTRDDEFAKAERDKAAGRSPMAIRVGDQWHSVGAFSPLANLVAIGATLYREEHQELKDESQRPLKIAAIAGKTVLEQPMLKGVSSLTETLTQPGRTGPRLLGNVAGSFVPTLISDVGAVTDTGRRDVRGIQDAVVNRIPILRRTLPESVDVFGKPLEARKSSAVDPTLASSARDVTDPLLKELTRLDAGVPKSSRKPAESEADYRARSIAEGQAMEKAGRWLISVRGYSAMSDEAKRDAFKDAFEQAKRELKRGDRRAPRELRRRPFRIPRAVLSRS